MGAGNPQKRQESGNGDGGGCVFCAIVAGTEPASVIYDDPEVLAFMDIRPINPGHILVVPKRHASNLAELDEPTGAWMFRVAMRLAGALRASGLRCEGVNLFLADGEAAGQEVFHVHLHAVPRFAGDNFSIDAAAPQAPRAELEAIAAQLRDTYESLRLDTA
jgi:diadenosine tetraphosphate (Ap4A) HIT family hydrolase